jgi:ABC-type Zn2+ transport system substrate-binding protein/surface adhesin
LINPNTVFTFSSYLVTDNGIVLTFVLTDPGAGESTEMSILLTDNELASVSTTPQLRSLVITKLQRRVRASGIASKLDPLIGQQVTI